MPVSKSKALRFSALCTVSMFAFAASGVAMAQSVEATQADVQTTNFDIPAQPLGEALAVFGEQADVLVLASADLTLGKQSAAVNGTFTPDAALSMLLNGQGLTAKRGADGSISIGRTSESTIASGVIVQAPSGGERASNPENSETSSEIVTGTVTASGTGAPLTGALVEILELGQRSTTNTLGEFRLSNVPQGQYTLRISYLGRDPIEVRISVGGDGFSQNFVMRSDGALDTIFVYGSRSARAQALNQERTALNQTTVLSSDLLGSFGGTTIADSLRRAPAVSFQRDVFSGEGSNIIVRGLEPDLNRVELNGIELAVGSGTGRSASLSNLLTESIESVTLNKSLLPSQASSGAGALIEIETKSPLSRPSRFASFSLEGAQRDGGFNDELLASATLSRKFGENENFGISGSIQYRAQENERLGYTSTLTQGEFLPLQIDGSTSLVSIVQVDPRVPYPVEPGADGVFVNGGNVSFGGSEIENLSLTLGAEWQVNDSTNLRLDVQRSEQTRDVYSANTQLRFPTSYTVRPIAELGGEVRRGLSYGGGINLFQNYRLSQDEKDKNTTISFRGQSDWGKLELGYSLGFAEGAQSAPNDVDLTVQFAGSSLWDSSFVADTAIDPVEGLILSVYPRLIPGDDSLPIPLLTEQGFALIGDASNYDFGSATVGQRNGNNERFDAQFDLKYNFDQKYLKYLAVGLRYEDSEFTNDLRSDRSYTGFREPLNTDDFFVDLEELGLELSSASLGPIGATGQFTILDRGQLYTLVNGIIANAPNQADEPTAPVRFAQLSPPDPLRDGVGTQEETISGYLEGQMNFRKLEVIGGFRVNHLEITAASVQGPQLFRAPFNNDPIFREQFRRLVVQNESQTDILPRFQFNYRKSDNLIFRGSYNLSVARPPIRLLSGDQSLNFFEGLFFGPNGDQPRLSGRVGNPDLEPAETQSFDLGGEYYFDNIGAIKAGIFYKRIDNLLESALEAGDAELAQLVLPDDGPGGFPTLDEINALNTEILVRAPQNNEDVAEIWGIELFAERQFDDLLPGIWSGFGIYANYTYTDSSKVQPVTFSFSPSQPDGPGTPVRFTRETILFDDVRFNQQPEHTGSVGLTYEDYGFSGNLAYTYQSELQTGFNSPRDQSSFTDEFGTLDGRLEYNVPLSEYSNTLNGRLRVYLDGRDLLRGTDDSELRGLRGDFYRSATYFGGRQIRLGASVTF